ncbi:MAG TPA: hypothetical protein VJ992_10670 [Gemmatimonadales bacterium]|nr:hypothetical protein [Gemmatimonadales bacterium]
MRRLLLLTGLALGGLPAVAAAQTSIFSVRGIGFPAREASARSRALGGGFDMFDPFSPLNPASSASLGALTAIGTSSTEFRSYDANSVTATGLHDTRFPLIGVAGPAGSSPISFRLTAGTYADRTYDVSTTDTVMLRGQPVGVTDQIGSDGAIADIGGALAWTVSRHLAIGVGVHALTGSSQLSVSRVFGDTTYRPYALRGHQSYEGFGFDGGVMIQLTRAIQLGASVRSDRRLDISVDSLVTGSVALPTTIAGGLLLTPSKALHWTTTVTRRSWTRAAADLAGSGTVVFNTFSIGSGIELGPPESGVSNIPLRFGFRYATLPFSPNAEQPHEVGLTAGTGLLFAKNRALVNVTLERIMRSGAGVSEHVWAFTVGMRLRP